MRAPGEGSKGTTPGLGRLYPRSQVKSVSESELTHPEVTNVSEVYDRTSICFIAAKCRL